MLTLSATYDQYKRLTPQEQQYIREHPHHALVIKDARDAAFAATRLRFGTRGGWNDKADAFRHCFWSAMLTRELGYRNALRFTTAHEAALNNPPVERTMDLYNNAVGLKLGMSKASNLVLSHQCYSALTSGRLKTSAK